MESILFAVFLLICFATLGLGEQGCREKVKDGLCEKHKKKCLLPAGSKMGKRMRKLCPKTCGYCGTGKCGISNVLSKRIVQGEDAVRGAWPWQILLLLNAKPKCGATLVAPNWVVTAAHCIEAGSAQYRIRVGEHNFNSKYGTEDDIKVSKIIVHPSHNHKTKNYDIALMKLSRPAILDAYVNTVCLPKQGQHVPVGTQCYVTGWGKQFRTGDMHHTLQQAMMPIVSKSECDKVNSRQNKITDNMVCAGIVNDWSNYVSSCHGDSGGPLVCQTGSNSRWELHGVVSWGSPMCIGTKRYTVFARVAQLRSWIDQNMKDN